MNDGEYMYAEPENRARRTSFHSRHALASYVDLCEATRYAKLAHFMLCRFSATLDHLRALIALSQDRSHLHDCHSKLQAHHSLVQLNFFTSAGTDKVNQHHHRP
jgi:hypothetical protein